MQDTMRLYRTLFGTRAYVRSVCEGAAFLAASSIAIFAAVTYATVHASNHVTDFVLSRVGPLQRALPVHLRHVHGLRHYGGPAGLAAEPAALRAQGHGAVPAGPCRVRGTHAHGAVADRSAAAGAVLQLDFLRQRSVLFRPHRPAVPRGTCLLAHPAMANILSRADRVLRLRSCCSATITIRSTCSPRCSSPTASF